MAYDLEDLGPTGFQDVAAALLIADFGPLFQAMGAGADGGRDVYSRGRLIWSGTVGQEGETWDGYTVAQVKHKKRLDANQGVNATWLWGEIRKELSAWGDDTSARGEVPKNYLVVTNVPLTPVHTSGGHDSIYSSFNSYRSKLGDDSRDTGSGEERRRKLDRLSRIRNFRVLDGNQVRALLDVHHGVRCRFSGFLTVGDVFANLAQFTGVVPADELECALRSHARTTLVGENSIYFDEAGGADGTGLPVHEVAIDLPITADSDGSGGEVKGKYDLSDKRDSDIRQTLIDYVLRHGEHILAPQQPLVSPKRHIIVAGAPGNGKTTVTRFLVQAYRAAMLSGADSLSNDQRAIIDGFSRALARLGHELPQHRRWAMRVDLAKHAEEYAFDEESTLVRYIAARVSARSDVGDIKASALRKWMKQWPWFLVLDGLDEVTEPTVRKLVIKRVEELVNDAEAENCDLFVVLTTRPIGYVEDIAPTMFERIDLDSLSREEAVRYGELATRVRLKNDSERIDNVIAKLTAAAHDDGLVNLLRTPLQVLIITIILDTTGPPAPDRFSLFWTYYDVVLRRERNKTHVGLGAILKDHAQHIQQLHELVGFTLQCRSESAERSFAALTHDELQAMTWTVLNDAGYKPSDQHADLLAKIVQAATHRLVLIAPRGNAGYGFDVRSLQELMAGKYLVAGPTSDAVEALRLAAPSPHWRNTWIFAAGSYFAYPQKHQHRAIVELLERLDDKADDRLSRLAPVGPRLALDLLDDGMARSHPRWFERLANLGLRVLTEPVGTDVRTIARTIVRFADSGDDQYTLIADGIRTALSTSATANQVTRRIQAQIDRVCLDVGAKAHTRWLAAIKPAPGKNVPIAPNTDWASFGTAICNLGATTPPGGSLTDLANTLQALAASQKVDDDTLNDLTRSLNDAAFASGITNAIAAVAPGEPTLLARLRDAVIAPINRTAIGDNLANLADSS